MLTSRTRSLIYILVCQKVIKDIYISKVLKFIITNTSSTAKSVSNSSKSPSDIGNPERLSE